ncbi:cytidylyltransferase domain-containing protein [Pandoraea pnomenusa]|uniref:acylneuraminate cytidylyltransferase family protein n=1 Tax=Pandoraea pnomenusa TaxID=93220 RepID=UPI0024314886|nr:acylneuraminate cytidylyltransferase family protein [Pandoraea pnomenusa]
MVDARILAVIPARGGSKRLPRKNARLLGGRPLISWSIDIALRADVFCDVLVTTDDEELASIGRADGALVPWLRPAALATDTATTSDVLRHALAWYEAERGQVSGVVLLQPTCPLRRSSSLAGALERYLAQPDGVEKQTVVSVSPCPVPPEWCFRIGDGDGALQPILGWGELGKRSQDLAAAFRLNGSLYIASSETIHAGRPLVGPGSVAFLMEGREESVDIDTEDDWRLAESFLPL